jgi:hypothetical protein
MRWFSALLFALSLAALNAVAGEDSTHKLHCTGANFYDSAVGLQNFNPAMSDCDAPTR